MAMDYDIKTKNGPSGLVTPALASSLSLLDLLGLRPLGLRSLEAPQTFSSNGLSTICVYFMQ